MVEINNKRIHKFALNRIIFYLTLSDVFTWGLYTVISVFAGIYLEKRFNGSAVEYIGIGISIFYLSKSVTQIPIGILTDRVKTYKDDILLLFLGNIFMAIPYFFYPILESPLPFYFLQFIMGLGASMNLVCWRKTFAKNIDVGKEGLSYAIYDTIYSLSLTLFGVIIGFVANISQSYFDLVMIVIGILMLSSAYWITRIYYILKSESALT